MFSIDPPDRNILSAFRIYLQTRSFYLLTEDGTAQPPKSRIFSASDAEKITAAFASAGNCAGIGRRHGTPMLYHFIITEITNGSADLRYALLEDIADLSRMTELLFISASFFQKKELLALSFPCLTDFQIRDFQIRRTGEILLISQTEK